MTIRFNDTAINSVLTRLGRVRRELSRWGSIQAETIEEALCELEDARIELESALNRDRLLTKNRIEREKREGRPNVHVL